MIKICDENIIIFIIFDNGFTMSDNFLLCVSMFLLYDIIFGGEHMIYNENWKQQRKLKSGPRIEIIEATNEIIRRVIFHVNDNGIKFNNDLIYTLLTVHVYTFTFILPSLINLSHHFIILQVK